VTQRPFAVTRRGRSAWPPLALVLRLLQEISGGRPASGSSLAMVTGTEGSHGV
jgi:hypothetical protein